MVIEVELFGQLTLDRQRRQALTLEQPATVRRVAALLELDPERIGLITINGVQSEVDDPIPPNCRLCFFPPLSGG
jgi:hypothetical protein